jgi:DNA-directed RNA polymerase subunit RPC12/RpoP
MAAFPDNHEKCDWTPWNDWENPGLYDTACGQTQYFSEEDVKGNNYIYCPYCGKQIFEKEAELKESDCNLAE